MINAPEGLIVWPDFSLSKNLAKKIISVISVSSNDPDKSGEWARDVCHLIPKSLLNCKARDGVSAYLRI